LNVEGEGGIYLEEIAVVTNKRIPVVMIQMANTFKKIFRQSPIPGNLPQIM